MKTVINKIISTLATFALIASMSITFVVLNVPNVSTLELHADSPTSEYAPYLGETVNFCGNQWDVIGIADGDYVAGSSAAEGTNAVDESAMLLLHNGDGSGNITSAGLTTAFNANGLANRENTNIYDGSSIQTKMAAQATLCSNNVTSEIFNANVKDTTIKASQTDSYTNDAHLSSGTELTSQKFFPLSINEANTITNIGLRACSDYCWLRSPGAGVSYASVVFDDGSVRSSGYSVDNGSRLARPALQITLDLFPHDCTTRRDTCDATRGDWVTLDGMRWDVVSVNNTDSDDPTALGASLTQPAKTATLLLSNVEGANTWVGDDGTDAFDSTNNNNYSDSDIRGLLASKYNGLGDTFKNLVTPRLNFETDFCGSASCSGSENTGVNNGSGDGLWLLSTAEATNLPGCNGSTSPCDFRKFDMSSDSIGWWLRSPGNEGSRAAFVDPGDGMVTTRGGLVSYDNIFSARPALFLNLRDSLPTSPTASIADITQGNTPAAPIVTGNEGEGTETVSGYVALDNSASVCNSTTAGSYVAWQTTNPAGYYCARVQISEATNYTPATAYAKFRVTEATPTTPNIDYENETLTGLASNATYEVGGTPASSDQEGIIDIAAYNLFGKSGIIRTNPDTSLNSAEQPLEIPALTRTLSVSTPTFDAVTYGYSPQPAAQNLTITASGVWGATVSGVTITNDTGAKFEIAGSASTVAPSGTLTSYTIQPKLGLSAGTHTVQVVVAYNNGTSATTATENVSITVNQKSVTLAKGSLVGVTRPFRTDDTTVELTGTPAITGLESADLADVDATCTGHYSDGNSAENKDITIDSCELSGDKADNYTISGSLPTGVQGTISNYQELIIGEGDVDVVVPPGSEYNPPSAAGAGDATVVLPGDAGDEFEIEVDGHDLIVPGSSVIHEDGTIIVPAGDVTVDGVTVNVPADSVVDVSTGTIALPNGDVVATHATGDEEVALDGGFDEFNAHSGENFTISGSGFTPGEVLRFELHSTPLFLGTTVVNGAGSFSFTGTIPANAESGDHHIVALDNYSGIELMSEAITIQDTIVAPDMSPVPFALAATGVNLDYLLGLLVLLFLVLSFLRKWESMNAGI